MEQKMDRKSSVLKQSWGLYSPHASLLNHISVTQSAFTKVDHAHMHVVVLDVQPLSELGRVAEPSHDLITAQLKDNHNI